MGNSKIVLPTPNEINEAFSNIKQNAPKLIENYKIAAVQLSKVPIDYSLSDEERAAKIIVPDDYINLRNYINDAYKGKSPVYLSRLYMGIHDIIISSEA
ncbi:hypothetical protein ACCT03_33675 [Rhizobium johnstonii]|uniref:hypothetical protein n=1 Tax=Rhizobium TaxID=379 RepID=UPI0010305E46|nr:hypothetical protein [Rhizobium leguminosarum]QND16917.1 hypothetical protein HB775_24420 [Rhizobium leguminosarum bv. trifolii]TBF22330.1 hypothetical protein ELG92_35350 [Rhizobium leguminosarum]TBH45440.1 hypothetical protein ELG65_37890 [Rhizobium leguminosarum]